MLTGDDTKRLMGECEGLICCPSFWDELADKINEEIERSYDEKDSIQMQD